MSDTTSEAPKLSWWRRLSGGLKRTSTSLSTAVADLVTKRKLDRAMVEERCSRRWQSRLSSKRPKRRS